MRIWTKPARKTNVCVLALRLPVEITLFKWAYLWRAVFVLHPSRCETVRGERYGFIRFGSRVDMYLPVDAQAQVAIGDKVTGVSTVLAFTLISLRFGYRA